MTRYFLDTEFIDTGSTIDLISIGVVSEDGREYYKQNLKYFGRVCCHDDMRDVPQWIIDNVFSSLSCDTSVWSDRTVMKAEILHFIDNEQYGKPELWGWCSGYDWVALCQLFGTMMGVPDGWPHYIKDIQFLLDDYGLSDDALPQQEEGLHNALSDAKHIKKIWEFLSRYEAEQIAQKMLTRYDSLQPAPIFLHRTV
ncbi:MAG TPA: 3'-5' exoribonuclease [Ktedonobacteraceae bacterium]|nr:3'-5' exoribonuclease [Ktedonobacteraceae bacterium]